MKKSIFYWSPCLNPVGTVKSTLNSAVSMSQYGKNEFDITLINACGEWDEYLDYFRSNGVSVYNFKYKFYKYLPKEGFIQSRFSYILIFFFCFIPLLRLLLNSKPDFLIAHLITSLPLTLMSFINTKTKFILRISGMPKLNVLRKNFWKTLSKKIFLITCPTLELRSRLIDMDLFDSNDLYFLPDAIIDIKKFIIDSKRDTKKLNDINNKRIIFAAGRLTKQKNFTYLIDEFFKFAQKNDNFVLVILGKGEEQKILEKKIKDKKLDNKVFLIGHVDSVYNYFKKGEVFILSSLWEEVGFVMVEAALSNLFIISSDCPNGPIEFLSNGERGILFKNNKIGELEKSLKKYCDLKNSKNYKIQAKKSAKKYCKFRHFLNLKNVLENKSLL